LNKYFIAVTSTNWRDGDYEETVYCYGMTDGNLNVRTKYGKVYTLPLSKIKVVLPTPVPIITYPIGSNVEFEYDYHQIDGSYTTFGKIVSCNTFYNDVTYSIQSFKDSSVKEYSARDVKRHVQLKAPKYVKGQSVSVVTVYAEHQLADEIRENGIITVVTPGFDKITYTVKLNSGATKVVEEYSIGKALPPPKTPQQQREDDAKYLREEEIRLLQQIEFVRTRMQRL
jgi:hypothetical protein